MWKEFTVQGNQKWLKILDLYNNKVYETIGVSANEATENPEWIMDKVNKNNEENQNLKEKMKFKIGDHV